LKQLIIGVCYSNLWVALQIALFSLPFSAEFFPPNFGKRYSFLVFLFSYLVYLLLRKDAIKKPSLGKEQPQIFWIYRHRNFLIFAALSAIVFILVLLIWYFPIKPLLLWLPILPLLVFYNWNFERKNSNLKSLRRFGGIKPLVITFCVVWIGFFSPYLMGILFFKQNTLSILLIFFEGFALFLFVLALVLPFDIRDMQYDYLDGLKTIPVIVGERKTRLLCMGLLFFYALVYAMILLLQLNSFEQIWPHFLTAIAGIALLADRDLTNESWEYLFWVDGLLGLPAMIWLVF
jgi:4-hydroxybenzoate polyprenyltransferase